MNKNNLYYKRGMYIIDKLLNIFKNDDTFYKKRNELLNIELNRMIVNQELFRKDSNSFYMTALSALIGLNKENIENLEKEDNYDFEYYNHLNKEFLHFTLLSYYKNRFDENRLLSSKFDNWLSVENSDYLTKSYLMNIRNGILHSEYDFFDQYGDIISLKNSNYTHFESKILLPRFLDFCMFYYGNNSWTGITEKFTIYGLDLPENQITNEKELDDLINAHSIIDVSYIRKNNKVLNPESILYALLHRNKYNKDCELENLLKKVFNNYYDYTYTKNTLNEEQKYIIKKMIEKYYGNKFYSLDKNSQHYQITMMIKYITNSRSLISEWICDFMQNYNLLNLSLSLYKKNEIELSLEYKNLNVEIGKRSVFCCRTSLLLIKLYHILYRIQNKNYESINYNDIDFDLNADDYIYTRTDLNGITNDFTIDKNNFKIKYPFDSEKEIENKVICEIIRNALSRGNIEIKIELVNDDIVEYIVFSDKYKSKNRELKITLEKLEKFLKSDSFKVENAILKKDKDIMIKKLS